MFWEHLIYNEDAPLLFNTGLFLVLFALFYCFYVLSRRYQTVRLVYVLLFSLFFYYKSSGFYFVLLVASTVWDYILGWVIYRCNEKQKVRRFILLVLSLIGNLGLLAYFKYTDFFIRMLNDLSGSEFSVLGLALPVGISFFTFQTMSYSIDIYRKELKPSASILEFAFFVSFFPQLVAGPIVRAKDFLPQIRKIPELHRQDMGLGFWLIIGGLFKKAIISDYISVNFVDRIFTNPGMYSGTENLLAVYGYTLQIYCDFSGYSDMAIGLALLMGFKLPPNFNAPYQSLSITEFWRRWHISLSTWLRDYLYISLGGNRGGGFGSVFFSLLFMGVFYIIFPYTWLLAVYGGLIVLSLIYGYFSGKNGRIQLFTYLNLSVTMLLGGFWHGAGLRFIVWGALHGLALALERALKPIIGKTKRYYFFKFLGWFWAFHFAAFCWIYFRASSFEDANMVIYQISYNSHWAHLPEIISAYSTVFILMGIGYFIHFFPARFEDWLQKGFARLAWPLQGLTLAFYIWLVLQIVGTEVHPFIYFDF